MISAEESNLLSNLHVECFITVANMFCKVSHYISFPQSFNESDDSLLSSHVLISSKEYMHGVNARLAHFQKEVTFISYNILFYAYPRKRS